MISPSAFLPYRRWNHVRKKTYSYSKEALPASDGQSMPTYSVYSHGDKYNFWHFLIIASYHENGAVYPNSIESLFLLSCRSCSVKLVVLEHVVFTWHLPFLNVLVMEKCLIVLVCLAEEISPWDAAACLHVTGVQRGGVGMWWCALLLFSMLNDCLYSCASSCIRMPARICWRILHSGMFYTEL